VLWKTQIKLYKITLDQQLEYYQTLASECLRIRRNIEEGFIPIGTNKKGTQDQENMDAPFPDLFPSVEAKFKEGMFQRNILGKFDDKWPILADDSLDIQIIFNKKEYSLNSFNDGKNRAILFRFLLINAKDVSIPFCQFLYEKIIFQPVEAGIEKQYFDAIRQEFCALLIERLKRIIVFKNGENIQQLLFKSNDNYPDDHCFYKNANGIFINKLIEGRYYPSVLLKNSNPYSHFSFIFPEDQNYEDRWVRVLSNARMINHHITHKSSIVSMLQTFSLNGIQDIFDREEVQTITNK